MLTIRDVGTADIPAVREVLVATWHATYDRIFGPEKVTEITDNWHSIDNLTRQIGVPQTAFLLGEVDGQVVATSHAKLGEDGSVALGRLYVLPARQGRSIGRALFDATIARFPDAPQVSLEVEPQNEAAIRFYARNGFERCGAIGTCGGRSDLEAIVMTKVLQEQPASARVTSATP